MTLRLREFELLAPDHTTCTEHCINTCGVIVTSHLGTLELNYSKRNLSKGFQVAHSFMHSFIEYLLSTSISLSTNGTYSLTSRTTCIDFLWPWGSSSQLGIIYIWFASLLPRKMSAIRQCSVNIHWNMNELSSHTSNNTTVHFYGAL